MTIRTRAQLDTILADNIIGAISPADIRDVLDSTDLIGEIKTVDGSTAQASLSTTPVKLTCFAANGVNKGVTPDHTNDKLTIDAGGDGDYEVAIQLSFSGSNSTGFTFKVRKNGVETDAGCERKLGVGGDVGSCSIAGVIPSLVATDYLEIYVEADAASKSVTVTQAQFIAKRKLA